MRPHLHIMTHSLSVDILFIQTFSNGVPPDGSVSDFETCTSVKSML